MEAKMTAAEAKVTAAEAKVTTAKEEVAAAEAKVTTAKEEVAAAKKEVTAAKEEMTVAKKEVKDALESGVAETILSAKRLEEYCWTALNNAQNSLISAKKTLDFYQKRLLLSIERADSQVNGT